MIRVNTVTILGANGNMGSLCGGLIAAFGNVKVFMVSRTMNKARIGIAKAMDSIKSDVIKNRLIPLTYSDLATCIPKSDWILEAVSEDIDIKHFLNSQISKFIKPKTIVSTTSSGLSITDLALDFDKDTQKYYFGTHFFNPPYKMLLCEVISNPNSDPKIQKRLISYLEIILLRQVIISKDKPAFVGNRIAFNILNEALIYSQRYGISYIDYLLGGVTGRVMSPLKTVDLVGLDICKAVVENIGLVLPPYVNELINKKKLGNKIGCGLYKFTKDEVREWDIDKHKYKRIVQFNSDLINHVKEKIREGKYKDAISIIINANTKEAKIIQYFFAKYIYVSFSNIGSVAENVEDVDRAMGFGYNWLPPSALVDLIGGKVNTIKLLEKFNFHTPISLSKYNNAATFYTLQNILDYRIFLRSV